MSNEQDSKGGGAVEKDKDSGVGRAVVRGWAARLFKSSGRKLHDIETALAVIQQIRSALAERPKEAPPISDAEALMVESQLRMLSRLIPEFFSFNDDKRLAETGAWPFAALRSKLGSLKSDGPGQLLTAVDAMKGLLETRRTILRAKGYGDDHPRREIGATAKAEGSPPPRLPEGAADQAGPAVAASESTGDASHAEEAATAKPPQDQAVSRQPKTEETGLLWGATEKLYSSWQFRILLLAMSAAVALAVAGSITIANQSWNLLDKLNTTASGAKDELDKLRINSTADIERRRTELGEKIAQANREVDLFHTQAEKLKKEAVEQIVGQINADLRKQESALHAEISAPLIKIRDEDVKSLREEITKRRGEIQALEIAISKSNDDLQIVGPRLQRLRELGQEAEKLAAALGTVKANEEAARKAASDAAGHAEIARQRTESTKSLQAEAEASRKKLSESVQAAAEDVIKQHRTLSAVQADLATLRRNMTGLDAQFEAADNQFKKTGPRLTDLDSGIGRAADQLKKLAPRIAQTDAEAGEIEKRLKLADERLKALAALIEERTKKIPPLETGTRPPPQGARSEETLTDDERKQIQLALVRQGGLRLKKGRPDGKFGAMTRQAISNFQRNIGAPVTGKLAPDQITKLLGETPTASGAPR